jgi:hypothetical protein
MKALLTTAVLLALALPAAALSPGEGVVVHFKDGTRVSGILDSLSRSEVSVDVGGARAAWRLASVRRLEAVKTDVQRFQELVQAAGEDPVKLQQAADFARRHGLYTYYAQLTGARAEPQEQEQEEEPEPRRAPVPQTAPAFPAPIAPLPPLGFATPTQQNGLPPGEFYAPAVVYAAPARPFSRREQRAFLARQAAERDARRHEATNPVSDFQFDLQQALDRQSRGLPFSRP